MIGYALFKNVPIHFGINWLLIPVLVFIMAGIGLGLGIIISSLTTKYRDFTVLIGFGVQLLMYATPVVYPLSFLADKNYASLIEWNPLSPIVEGFRYALFNVGAISFISILYSIIFMIIVMFIGAVYFSKVERTFMDTV
jgi:lipopolysaccharide transport system permease protein